MRTRQTSDAELEERIISMRFDNTQFKAASKETIAALNQLDTSVNSLGKSSGNVDSLSKALDEMSRASGLKSMANDVENIASHFTWWGRTVDNVVDGITNKVIGMGVSVGSTLKNLAAEFVGFDPGMGGFHEYELMMNSIQTIKTNTASHGTTLDDINEALAKLNEYADQTIYNFQDMTRNIGTFTAAGVELQDATDAIKGIANLGAGVGSTASQVANAMYQLSQALASGTVTLQDWNSVVNAGMGGELFQNALKETAKELAEARGEVFEAFEGTFRESISAKDGTGWLTSEVLLETLKKFANDPDLLEAATRVRSWSMLIDSTKEAIGSGWTISWQYFIGDLDEAADLFTMLAKAFESFINPIHDARNEMLKFWHDNGGRASMIRALSNVLETLSRYIGAVSSAWQSIFPPMSGEGFIKATNSIEAFTEALIPSEDQLDAVYGVFYNLFSILRFVKDALVIATDAVISGIKFAWGPFSVLLNGLLGMFAALVDWIARFLDPLDILNEKAKETTGRFSPFVKLAYILLDVLSALGHAFVTIGAGIGEFLNKIGLGGFVTRVSDSITSLTTAIKEMTIEDVTEGFDSAIDKLKQFYNTIKISFPIIQKFESFISSQKASLDSLCKTIEESGGIFSFLAKKLSEFKESFKEKFSWVNLNLFNKEISDTANETADSLTSWSGVLKTIGFIFDNFVSQVMVGSLYLWYIVSPMIEEFANGVKTLFYEISNMSLSDLMTLISIIEGIGLFRAAKSAIKGIGDVFSALSDLLKEGKNVVKNLGNVFKSLTGILDAVKFNLYSDIFIKLAIAIGILAAAIIAISIFDTNSASEGLKALVDLVGIMAGILAVLAIMNKFKIKVDTAPFLMLSAGIAVISIGISKLATITDLTALTTIVSSIIGLIWALALVPIALSAVYGLTRGGHMEGTMIGLISFVASVYLLIGAVRKLAVINSDEIDVESGITRLNRMLTGLGIFFLLALNLGKMSTFAGVGMLIMNRALKGMVDLVYTLGLIDDEIDQGAGVWRLITLMFGIGTVLSILAGMTQNIAGSKAMLAAAGAFSIIAIGLSTIGLSLKVLDSENITVAKLTAFTVALSALAVVIGVFLTMGAYFSNSKKDEVAGINFSIFGNASAWATNILILSSAFLALVAAFKMFSTLDFSQILAGLGMFATFLAITMGISKLGVFFDVFGDGIGKVATAILKFTLALMGLGALLAVGGPLLAIIAAGSNTIIKYLYDIGVAVLGLVVSLSSPLFDAVGVVCLNLVDAVSMHLPGAIKTIGNLFNSLIKVLAGETFDNFIITVKETFATYGKSKKLVELEKEIALKRQMLEVSPASDDSPYKKQLRADIEKLTVKANTLRKTITDLTEKYANERAAASADWESFMVTGDSIKQRNQEYMDRWGVSASIAPDSSLASLSDIKEAFSEGVGTIFNNSELNGLLPDTSEAKEQLKEYLSGIFDGTEVEALLGGQGLGDNLLQGFLDTLQEGESAGENAGLSMIASYLFGANEEAEINSPSKKTAYIGEMLVAGLVGTLEDSRQNLYDEGYLMVVAIFDGMQTAIDDVVTNEAIPTISPIVDFSKIQNQPIVGAYKPAFVSGIGSAVASEISYETNRVMIGQDRTATLTDLSARLEQTDSKLDNISEIMSTYLPFLQKFEELQVVMDSGALVGELAPKIDTELGRRQNMSKREGRR